MITENWRNTLRNSALQLHLNLAEEVIEKFAAYTVLLVKWNKTYNLTAVDEPDGVLKYHLLDSLALAPYITGSHYMLDVGSGAGFPGIPLALAMPSTKFVLLDSNNKKARFLRHAVMMLALGNVRVVHERMEKFTLKFRASSGVLPSELLPFDFPTCFDTIATRATSTIKEIVLQTHHLCCANGQWLLMKGKYPDQELQEFQEFRALQKFHKSKKSTKTVIESMPALMKLVGNVDVAVHRLEVPELNAERHVVCIKKQ